MSNKFLKFLKFSQLTYWTAKRYFAKELQLTNKYPKVLMGFFLSKSQPNIINIKDEGQYKIIGVRSYGKGAYINREVAGQQLTMKKYQLAKANQLIWCKVDTKNGAFGIVNDELANSYASSNMCLVDIDNSKILNQYLQLLFTSQNFQRYLDSFVSGTTNRKYIKLDELLNSIEVPLPPIEKQREIVEKYNAKIKLAEEQEQKAKNLEKEIDLYLNDALGIKEDIKVNFNKQIKNIRFIPFKNLSRWDSFFFNNEFKVIDNCLAQAKYECKKVDQVVEKLINGVDSRQYMEKGVPYLRVSNIKPNKIEISDIKYIENCNKNTKGFVKKNEILITRKGTYGNAVVVTEEDEKHNFVVSSEVFKLTLKDADIINPYYFQYYINSSFCKLQMERVKTRGIMGSLTQEALLNLIIPLPPICVQNDIVLNIEKKQKNITTLLVQFEQNKIDAQQEFEKELFE